MGVAGMKVATKVVGVLSVVGWCVLLHIAIIGGGLIVKRGQMLILAAPMLLAIIVYLSYTYLTIAVISTIGSPGCCSEESLHRTRRLLEWMIFWGLVNFYVLSGVSLWVTYLRLTDPDSLSPLPALGILGGSVLALPFMSLLFALCFCCLAWTVQNQMWEAAAVCECKCRPLSLTASTKAPPTPPPPPQPSSDHDLPFALCRSNT